MVMFRCSVCTQYRLSAVVIRQNVDAAFVRTQICQPEAEAKQRCQTRQCERLTDTISQHCLSVTDKTSRCAFRASVFNADLHLRFHITKDDLKNASLFVLQERWTPLTTANTPILIAWIQQWAGLKKKNYLQMWAVKQCAVWAEPLIKRPLSLSLVRNADRPCLWLYSPAGALSRNKERLLSREISGEQHQPCFNTKQYVSISLC